MASMTDDRRSVTIRVTNLEHVRGDDGTSSWTRQHPDAWTASCETLRDAVAAVGSLRHSGVGVDWNAPSGSLEVTWALIVDVVGVAAIEELRDVVEAWLVDSDRTAAWFFVAEPTVARGAFLQARPR